MHIPGLVFIKNAKQMPLLPLHTGWSGIRLLSEEPARHTGCCGHNRAVQIDKYGAEALQDHVTIGTIMPEYVDEKQGAWKQ